MYVMMLPVTRLRFDVNLLRSIFRRGGEMLDSPLLIELFAERDRATREEGRVRVQRCTRVERDPRDVRRGRSPQPEVQPAVEKAAVV